MDEKKRIGIIVAVCFVFGAALAAGISTQYIAAKLSYQESLTWSVYEGDGYKLYFPFAAFHWFSLYKGEAPRLFSDGFKIFSWSFFGMGVAIFILRHYLTPKITTSHGSARWATKKEIKGTGLLDGKGIFIGALPSGEYLRDNEKTHDLIVAPTRSGKGVTIVNPTAFTWVHSLFLIDPKGEAWQNTSSWREKKLRNIVYKFAPGERDSHHFNFFDEIRFGRWQEFRDADNQSKLICDPSGMLIGTDHGYWAAAASVLLTGILLHIKYTTGYVCVDDVINFLTDLAKDEASLQDKLIHCTEAVHDPDGRILNTIYKSRGATHPRVKQIFTKMGLTPPREFGSIYSTLDTALNVYRDPILAENTRYSDFSVQDFLQHDRPISVYFCVTPDDLTRLGPVMRIMTELVYRRNVEKFEMDENGGNAGKRRLLMMIDEFPALGRMENFEKALAFVAGYGIKTVLITQGLNQINKLYTDRNSLFDNSHVRVFFTPNDRETPRYISEMLGKKTIRIRNKYYNGSVFQFLPAQISEQEIGRELMTNTEITTMDADNSVIFVAGKPPIFGRKFRWYEDRNFKNRKGTANIRCKTDEEAAAQIEKIKKTWRKQALEALAVERQPEKSQVYDEVVNPFSMEWGAENEHE